jgi:hypothetical protein
MPLTSYADLRARAISDSNQLVYQRVQSRIHDVQRPMPPSGMPDEDIALIDAWLGNGAAVSDDPTCAGQLPAVQPDLTPEFQWPSDCEDFYTLTTSNPNDPTRKYSVAGGGEEHPQFIFDAPWGDDKVQVLAYRPITDNARVLHHWILYENASTGIFAGGLGGKFLVGWAPGSQGTTEGMPPDVGLYMPGGKKSLRLDVHYYNLGTDQPALDQSGLELCITRTPRKYTATVIGLTGNATAKPGRSDNVTSCTAVTTGDVHLLSVSPHMHKLGVHGKLEQTRGGQTTALHDQPFDFNDQRVWPLENVPVQNGDVFTTTCSYENDTGAVVSFGQNSDNEMCFNFVTYYPMGSFSCGFAL